MSAGSTAQPPPSTPAVRAASAASALANLVTARLCFEPPPPPPPRQSSVRAAYIGTTLRPRSNTAAPGLHATYRFENLLLLDSSQLAVQLLVALP